MTIINYDGSQEEVTVPGSLGELFTEEELETLDQDTIDWYVKASEEP